MNLEISAVINGKKPEEEYVRLKASAAILLNN